MVLLDTLMLMPVFLQEMCASRFTFGVMNSCKQFNSSEVSLGQDHCIVTLQISVKRQDGGGQEQQDGEPYQLQDEGHSPGKGQVGSTISGAANTFVQFLLFTSRTLAPSSASSRHLTST